MTERLDIMDIEPDFSHHSNFNDKAGVAGVKFGADAPVLEVELNELQQIQDLAREDLIRSMIPSGFTKVPEIDFSLSTLTTLVTANDAEAYVNGMRIFIPKGTVIDAGEAPEKESREDLIFLEVWKEEVGGRETLNQYGGEGQPHTQNTIIDIREKEETSHRIINKWRIRHVADVDFNTNPDGLRNENTNWDICRAFAQGGNDSPLNISDLSCSVFSTTCTNTSDNPKRNWAIKDAGLYLAGKGDDYCRELLKTVDGYCYAIPIFKLQRRPKSGFKKGSYDLIAPTADPVKVNNVVKEERVAGVSTGEVDMLIKGKTLKNEFFVGQFSDLDAKIRYENLNKNIKQDVPYIIINTSDKPIVLDINKILDNSFVTQIEIPANSYKIHKYTQETYSFICSGAKSSGWSSDNKEQLKKACIILEGIYEDVNINHFEGIKSSGEDEVAFREFINYPCSITKGVSIDGFATIPYKPETNLIKVVPVDAEGKEIIDVNIAYKVLNAEGGVIAWKSTLSSLELTDADKSKVEKILMYNNTSCSSYVIKGFNIYDGYSIRYVAKINEDKETIKEFRLKEPLRGLPNGVCDTINRDGVVVRRVGKRLLNGALNESWYSSGVENDEYITFHVAQELGGTNGYSNLFSLTPKTYDSTHKGECFYPSTQYNVIYFKIAKSKLESQDVEGFKKWLQSNPLEVYYEKKLYEPLADLPNGVSDIDNNIGEVTRNIKAITYNGSEDWGHFTGDKASNSLYFNLDVRDGLPCTGVDSNRLPFISNWEEVNFKDTEGIILANDYPMLRVRIAKSKLESQDVAGFKKWLKANPLSIFYILREPTLEKYPVEKSEITGDLYFNSKGAEIISKNNIPPELTLKHKADMNLDIYKDITHISCDSNIPATITCEEVSKDNFLDLTPSEDKKQVPVKLEGMTYQNLAKISSLASGNSFENGIITLVANGTWSRKVKFDTSLLKPNTTYTVIVNCISNNVVSSSGNAIAFYNAVSGNNEKIAFSSNETGLKTAKITSKLDLTEVDWWIEPTEIATSGEWKGTVIILEGDYTNKYAPSYFEGIKSVGELENKVCISSSGKNLFDKNRVLKNKSIHQDLGIIYNLEGAFLSDFIELDNEITLTLGAGGDNIKRVCYFNANKQPLGINGIYAPDALTINVKKLEGAKYIRFQSWLESIEMTQAEYGQKTSYEPYKGSKKAFNLPIPYGLKGLPNGTKDFIEKRKDGYYLVQQVGRAILDGSGTIGKDKVNTKTMNFYIPVDNCGTVSNNIVATISDKLPSITQLNGFMNDNEGIWLNDPNSPACIFLTIEKSKLTTQDEDGLRAWLKKNPITVYYKLKDKKEYKLDSVLITDKHSAEFALEGQVGYKKVWNGGANLNKIALTPAYPYGNWLDIGLSRIFNYEVLDGEDFNGILNVPIVPYFSRLVGEKDLITFNLSVLEILPNNQCLVKCNLSGIGGQSKEFFVVPSQFSSKVCAKDVESLCKRVSLIGWDYNQVLEETLFNLLK